MTTLHSSFGIGTCGAVGTDSYAGRQEHGFHFPELIAELEAHLNMMEYQALSPGLKSALCQTRTKINRLRNNGRNQNRRDKADA